MRWGERDGRQRGKKRRRDRKCKEGKIQGQNTKNRGILQKKRYKGGRISRKSKGGIRDGDKKGAGIRPIDECTQHSVVF